ncbi:MAG: hypothetical protein IKM54_05195 [Butyricicoccus sp.]|nr:hypothetical protein [Butyricicoccus sp.]
MKDTNNIYKWTAEACRKIAFLPDRKAMERELTDHFEDHRDALLDGGMSAADAEELALRAMGDAEEVGEQLAQVYNNIWTKLWRFSRGALWTLLILFILCRVLTRPTSPYQVEYFDFGHLDDDTQVYYSQEALAEYNADFTDETVGRKLTLTDWTAGTSDAQDTYMDFDWSVEKWARYYECFEMNDLFPEEGDPPAPVESDRCTVLLRVQDHALYPGEIGFAYSDFYAVDNFGNAYADYDAREEQAHYYMGSNAGRVLNRYYIELHLTGVTEKTEWIELRAGDDETGLRLWIDLTKGEVLG